MSEKSKYYLLKENEKYLNHGFRLIDYPIGYNFELGERIDSDIKIPDPLVFRIRPAVSEIFCNKIDLETPSYLEGEIPLFRDDFLSALQEYGVNNIDSYNALIASPSNFRRHTNYKAVNILGVVEAIFELDKLEIPIIRLDALVETTGILVQEKLKDFLIEKGFDDLEFTLIELHCFKQTVSNIIFSRDNMTNFNAIHSTNSSNFREVKMGTIKPHILYRSAHPVPDGKQDRELILAIAKAGIKTVLNLTDSESMVKSKSVVSPAYRKLVQGGNVIALSMSFDFLSPLFQEKLGEGIRFMLNHPGPYLVHCHAGIDRTGFVIAALSALMGASLKEITNDYMASFDTGVHSENEYLRGQEFVMGLFVKMNSEMAVNEGQLQEIAAGYFLDKVKLLVEELDKLKNILSVKNY